MFLGERRGGVLAGLVHDRPAQQRHIASTQLDQFLVAAALDDLAIVEHKNLIGVADCREAVGDRDRGASA